AHLVDQAAADLAPLGAEIERREEARRLGDREARERGEAEAADRHALGLAAKPRAAAGIAGPRAEEFAELVARGVEGQLAQALLEQPDHALEAAAAGEHASAALVHELDLARARPLEDRLL